MQLAAGGGERAAAPANLKLSALWPKPRVPASVGMSGLFWLEQVALARRRRLWARRGLGRGRRGRCTRRRPLAVDGCSLGPVAEDDAGARARYLVSLFDEVYASDILRKVKYDAFGEKVIPTSPIRLDSIGDPVLRKSRPIGYDTAAVMTEYGYSDEEIRELDGEAVTCYHGPSLPDSVFEPSYGPRSKMD